MNAIEIKKKLESVFNASQAEVLADVITVAYSDLVKTSDFNELKSIVKELAEAQKRTETKVEELAEAQKRTETKVGELAEAQKRTETKVEELAEAQKRTEIEVQKIAMGLNNLRVEVGGLSRSVSYGFENEVYRMLPNVLKEKYGVIMEERLIRVEIGRKEINILGKAKKDGKEVIVVGEVKLRLQKQVTGEKDVFEELEDKALAVKKEYKQENIVKVLIAHYATKEFIKDAEDKNIIVIQSFEL